MRMPLSILCLAALVQAVAAQDVVDLTTFEPCDPCELEFVQTAVIGDASGPGVIESDPVRIVLDGQSGYVVYLRGEHVVTRFAPDGSGARRLGRAGRGPGELSSVTDVAFASDGGVVVLDTHASSWVRYSAAGELVHQSRQAVPTVDRFGEEGGVGARQRAGYRDARLDIFDLRARRHVGTRVWDDPGVRLFGYGGRIVVSAVEYDAAMVPRVVVRDLG